MSARPFAPALLLVLAAVAPAPAAEIAKLHVLVVVDSTDDNLKLSVERDERRVKALFTSILPPDRVAVTPLSGSLNRGKVLDEVAKLKPGPNDGVVFYYAGHGGKDAKSGRLFFATGWKPEGGKLDPLFRDEVLKALAAKSPALTVLLTDCCSNPIDLGKHRRRGLDDPGFKEPANTRGGSAYGANMKRLFLDARGVVDLTAATDDVSWGTPYRGGFFTYTLAKTIDSEVKVGSWRDLVDKVSKETPNLHADQARRGFVPAPGGAAKFQTPRAYSLGVSEKLQYAVITLWTPEAKGMKFQYRWSDGSDWAPIALQKDKQEVVAVVVEAGQQLPTLEVDLADSKGVQLKAKRYEGSDPPAASHGQRYKATPPKP